MWAYIFMYSRSKDEQENDKGEGKRVQKEKEEEEDLTSRGHIEKNHRRCPLCGDDGGGSYYRTGGEEAHEEHPLVAHVRRCAGIHAGLLVHDMHVLRFAKERDDLGIQERPHQQKRATSPLLEDRRNDLTSLALNSDVARLRRTDDPVKSHIFALLRTHHQRTLLALRYSPLPRSSVKERKGRDNK